MRTSTRRWLVLGLCFLIGGTVAQARPATPVIAYPNQAPADPQNVNIKVNPTIFWSAYARPEAGFEQDIQKSFQIQIADALPFDSTTVVYTTDGGPGNPPDCSAATRPRCLGAGMAHFVGVRGSYAGIFGNALAGKDRLDEGTVYYLRLRVQSAQDGTWSAWSDTVMFTTVAYDGDTYYVSTSGLDGPDCGGPASECASLGYVLNNLVQDDHGDTVIVRPGTYDVPCASSHPSCPQSSPVDIDFSQNDFPRRVWIRGESPTLRPILQLSLYVDAPDVGWMLMFRARDVILQNLILSGPEACCTGMDSNNSYVILMDGRDANRNERLSFINVETRRNVIFQLNNSPFSGGEIDVLWLDFHQQGEPIYDFAPWHNRNDNNNPKLTVTRNSTYLTFKGFQSRDVDDHITMPGELDPDGGLFHTYRHILIEDSEFYRANIHPFRPESAVENFTLRRTLWGDGAEQQPAFSSATTSLRNAVFENNTIAKGLLIGNNNGDSLDAGTIGYLVIRNNIFSRVDIGDSGGVLQVVDVTDSKTCFGRCVGGVRDGLACGWCDREVLIECTSDSQCSNSCNSCPGGACVDSCDVLGPADRISVDYNIYHVPWDYFSIVHWDGGGSSCSQNKNGVRGGIANCYSRRGSSYSENWDAWLALGHDTNAPFQTYNGGANREPVDPMLMYVPNNDGSLGYADLRLQPGSPAIDAGDPGTWVPPGGGSRVDIGGYEAQLGPVITPIDPEDGDACVPEGTSVVTFRIDAAPGSNVDVGTLSVQVAGASVTPDVVGSGASLIVSVDVPGGSFPASTLAEISVSVSDDALPPRASDLTYFFLTQPAAPTGVVAD